MRLFFFIFFVFSSSLVRAGWQTNYQERTGIQQWSGKVTSPSDIYIRNGQWWSHSKGNFVGVGEIFKTGEKEAAFRAQGGLVLAEPNYPKKVVPIETLQKISNSKLAKVGGAFLRYAPLIGLGLALKDIFWSADDEKYMIRDESIPDENPGYIYKQSTQSTGPCTSYEQKCSLESAIIAQQAQVKEALAIYEPSVKSYTYQSHDFPDNPGSTVVVQVTYLKNGSPDFRSITGTWEKCPEGSQQIGQYQCTEVKKQRVATDEEIDNAVLKELTEKGLSVEVARRLIENGYMPQLVKEMEPISEIQGPASVDGEQKKVTTMGPDGATTVETRTRYDLGYDKDTVTVTEQKTESVTTPDGQTKTTTTTTEAPSDSSSEKAPSSEEPPEPPPDLCEKYPNISACQELGDDYGNQDLGTEERSFSFSFHSTSGSCPAPYSLDLLGKSLSYSFEPFCDFARALRPIVIAVSLLSSGLFLMAIGNRS